MNIPEFEPDGSWSMTIRPNQPPVMAKLSGKKSKKSGIYNINLKVKIMKYRNIAKKFGAVVVGSLAGLGAASAAVPTEVTAALTSASTDGVSIAGTILGVIIAIVAFKYIRRAA